MKTYIVAVSGGVDSVVLLHRLWKLHPAQIVIAHFDHGMRPDSASDQAFVKQLAKHYDVTYETKREELGDEASEELARERRYAFLRDVAARHDGVVVTGHHADDVIETIAINLRRGTGWRGLAVLDSPDIIRPLLDVTKSQILSYARQHQLTWREDSTNHSEKYLRNRLRARLSVLDDDAKRQLRGLWRTQLDSKRRIETLSRECVGQAATYDRHLFIMSDEMSASELLRMACQQSLGVSPTRPQRERALLAIKTMPAGKTHQIGAGIALRFSERSFSIYRF